MLLHPFQGLFSYSLYLEQIVGFLELSNFLAGFDDLLRFYRLTNGPWRFLLGRYYQLVSAYNW